MFTRRKCRFLPPTPAEYFAEGYKTAYNQVIAGEISEYDNTVQLANEEVLNDYLNGLLSGAADAREVLMGSPVQPSINTFAFPDNYPVLVGCYSDGTHQVLGME